MTMTYKEVAKMVKSIGLPYAYYQFPEGTNQKLPFVCYFYGGIDDIHADNSNYQRIERLNIELYTKDKDFAKEAMVETALANYEMSYLKEDSYIDSEKMWQIAYEMEVIING